MEPYYSVCACIVETDHHVLRDCKEAAILWHLLIPYGREWEFFEQDGTIIWLDLNLL